MQFIDYKKADIKGVKDRFMQIISDDSQKWWANKLNVSQGLISSSWKSGKLPRIETLFNILKIKSISPTWFFFGIEPKNIEDLDGVVDDQHIKQNREAHRKMLEAERELMALRERIAYLESCLKVQELSLLVPFLHGKEDDTPSDMFKTYILPMITLMRLLNDVSFKALEYMANGLDHKKLIKMIDWVKSNFESSQFTAIAALKDLEKEIR